MFGSSVLESAIGLAFVFLLVSILVTAASEVLANALQLRARCLRQGVEAMLSQGKGADRDQGGLAAQIFTHPLITGGTTGGAVAPASAGTTSRAGGPSYIPAKVFSSALCESLGLLRSSTSDWPHKLHARLAALPAVGTDAEPVATAVKEVMSGLSAALSGASLRKELDKVAGALGAANADVEVAKASLTTLQASVNDPELSWLKPTLAEIAKNPTAKDVLDLMNHIPSAGAGAAAYLDRLKAWVDALPKDATGYTVALAAAKSLASVNGSAADLRVTLERLPDGDVKRTLLLLFDEAAGDVVAFKLKIEAWFDASMNRVSGWYKRRTAWVNFGLGMALAVTLNVDALLVLNRLTTDPSLRTALVNEAASYTTKGTAKAAPTEGSTSTTADGTAAVKAMPDSKADFEAVRKEMDGLGVPIGWAQPSSNTASYARAESEGRVRPSVPGLFSCDGKAWTLLGHLLSIHALGWLLTGLAASLGAPFWFDILDKFMNIRNAGKRPDADKKTAQA